VIDDEHQPHRDDREIQSLKPERERPDREPDERRQAAGQRQQDPERQTETRAADAGRGGANREKGRMPETDLAGEARDDRQADRSDDRDQRHVCDRQPLVVGQGQEQQQKQTAGHESDLVPDIREQRLIVLVARDESARRHASGPLDLGPAGGAVRSENKKTDHDQIRKHGMEVLSEAAEQRIDVSLTKHFEQAEREGRGNRAAGRVDTADRCPRSAAPARESLTR